MAAKSIERPLYQLLGFDPAEPAAAKWVAFARNLLLVFVASAAGLWLVLTYNSISSARELLNESLAAKGRTIAAAAARAAFVPLVLKDDQGLDRIAHFYESEPDLAYLEVREEGGGVSARYSRPELEARGRLIVEGAPVAQPAEYADQALPAGKVVGSVRAGMSRRRVDRTLAAVAMRNALGSGLLLVIILAAGTFVIRGMTHGLRELIDEARLTEALRRSNEDLGQFAFAASHDLQAPLRTIASYVQLIKKRYHGKLDAEGEQFIDTAASGALRMQALIQDLLEFSRVGRAEPPKELTDLNKILDQAVTSLAEPIREAGAQLSREPLPTVRANPLRIQQLFENLIGNAVKYRGEQPPRIRVWAESRGEDYWVISISDNGIGIEEQYFEKIFVIFQRLHTRTEYPGTGIGLALCRKIVENQGGRIWLESKPGVGTTFRFSIPAGELRGGRAAVPPAA